MDGIWSRLVALPLSADNSHLEACIVAEGLPHFFARGTSGEPILLLAALPRARRRIPLQLRNIIVDFEVECSVHGDASELGRGRYVRVVCDPRSPALHEYFVRALTGIVRAYSGPLSADDADEVIDRVVDLFSRLSQVPKTSIVGLWGELFVIDRSSDADRMIDAWHSTVSDVVDFADRGYLEVKATESRDRLHEVGLDQIRPTDDRLGCIASVLLRKSAGGISVIDLGARVAARVNAERGAKIWRLIAETLGPELEGAEGARFDEGYAATETKFFASQQLPAPTIMPADRAHISNVHYRLSFAAFSNAEVSPSKAEATLFLDAAH